MFLIPAVNLSTVLGSEFECAPVTLVTVSASLQNITCDVPAGNGGSGYRAVLQVNRTSFVPAVTLPVDGDVFDAGERSRSISISARRGV